jgi:Leucine-rich repeat (LRR) protein
MHARSHYYPDVFNSVESEQYTETTYYDPKKHYLDIGYQRLKVLDIAVYPGFSGLTRLHLDHNCLEKLPGAEILSNLRELNAGHNRLQEIPYYPRLRHLQIGHNRIKGLPQYRGSRLQFLDCSFNQGIDLNILLPYCQNLYCTDNGLVELNLDYFPVLHVLDAEHNRLTRIQGCPPLQEANLEDNCLSTIPVWTRLEYLNIGNNRLSTLPVLSCLRVLHCAHNRLTRLPELSSLEELMAEDNRLSSLDNLPKATYLDLAHNFLHGLRIPQNVRQLSLQFNPIDSIAPGPNLQNVQVGFNLYAYLYKHYYGRIHRVMAQTNGFQLEKIIQKIRLMLPASLVEYIYQIFSHVKFNRSQRMLYQVSRKIYQYYCPDRDIRDDPKKFLQILVQVFYLYHATLVVTVYFKN